MEHVQYKLSHMPTIKKSKSPVSQLVNAKDYISRQSTSILMVDVLCALIVLIVIALEMLKNWPALV